MRPPGIRIATGVMSVTLELGRRAERDVRLAAGDATHWVAVRVVDEERAQRALTAALQSPAFERAVAQVLASRVVDEAIDQIVQRTLSRLAASPELWALIDEIAQSPAVREAISSQGVTMAEELAGDVRTRSRHADDQVERVARRILHWRRGSGPVPEPGT